MQPIHLRNYSAAMVTRATVAGFFAANPALECNLEMHGDAGTEG